MRQSPRAPRWLKPLLRCQPSRRQTTPLLRSALALQLPRLYRSLRPTRHRRQRPPRQLQRRLTHLPAYQPHRPRVSRQQPRRQPHPPPYRLPQCLRLHPRQRHRSLHHPPQLQRLQMTWPLTSRCSGCSPWMRTEGWSAITTSMFMPLTGKAIR